MKYLSVGEAAKRFGINARTVYKEVEAGRLPSVKIGDPNSKRPTIRLPLAALEAWEAAQLSNGVENAQLRR